MSEFTACSCSPYQTRNEDVQVTICSQCRCVKYDDHGVSDGESRSSERACEAAYARGKADGMAEAVTWLRSRKNLAADTYADALEAGALERGEHKK